VLSQVLTPVLKTALTPVLSFLSSDPTMTMTVMTMTMMCVCSRLVII